MRDLRGDRWHEADTRLDWPLPADDGHSASKVEGTTLAGRHESLRTAYA
ncbi:hypothetical protein [Streptomyces sp. NPDC057052]